MPMPYELRSPEDIAMEYGGNKQKIGAAVQAGLLDPTAGVLAGMFIDRMRSAAVEEQAPASTVAQDTLSPRPAPAPGAGAVPAGLAAMQSPQAAPMQPTPAPGAGAVQMARGGLAMLDVPDTMYDYGGGGIVAFAEGDAVTPSTEARRRLLMEQLRGVTPREQLEQMTLEDLESAMAASEFSGPGLGAYGDEGQVLAAPEPQAMGPRTQASLSDLPVMSADIEQPVAPLAEAMQPAGDAGLAALARVDEPQIEVAEDVYTGPYAGLEEAVGSVRGLMGDIPKGEATQQLEKLLAERGSPEALKARGKENVWAAVAEMGARMMAGKSPYALQNIGEAAAATVPSMKEALKDKREAEMEFLKARSALEQADRKEQAAAITTGAEVWAKDRAAKAQEASATKKTNMGDYVQNYLEAARAKGDTRPEPILRREGGQEFLQLYGGTGRKVDISAASTQSQIQERASELFDEQFRNRASGFNATYRAIKKEQGQKAASEYYDRERAKFINNALMQYGFEPLGGLGVPAAPPIPTVSQPTQPSQPRGMFAPPTSGAPAAAPLQDPLGLRGG